MLRCSNITRQNRYSTTCAQSEKSAYMQPLGDIQYGEEGWYRDAYGQVGLWAYNEAEGEWIQHVTHAKAQGAATKIQAASRCVFFSNMIICHGVPSLKHFL